MIHLLGLLLFFRARAEHQQFFAELWWLALHR